MTERGLVSFSAEVEAEPDIASEVLLNHGKRTVVEPRAVDNDVDDVALVAGNVVGVDSWKACC